MVDAMSSPKRKWLPKLRRKSSQLLLRLARWADPDRPLASVAELAREEVRAFLVRLQAAQPQAVLSHEAAMERAKLAQSFIDHPYWAMVSRMLTGTIQAETEEMLAGDGRLAVNRASVAMCRKVLLMPFFDIEQGRAAEAVLIAAMAKIGGPPRPDKDERIPWLREIGS